MRKILVAALAVIAGVAPACAQSHSSPGTGSFGIFREVVPNNDTAIRIKALPGWLTGVWGFDGTSSETLHVKLYDSAAATLTCGTSAGTPLMEVAITNGEQATNPIKDPVGFVNGIWACVVTGAADSSTGAPTASASVLQIEFQ